MKSKKPIYRKWWFWVIVVVLFIGVIGSNGDSSADNGDAVSSSSENRAASAVDSGDAPDASSVASDPEKIEINGFSLSTGTILDANPEGGVNGDTLVIKAKINSLLSNQQTINQNYYNVADIIQNQGGTQFNCIDYWAVADATDGSEIKVVAFTVDADTIQAIADGMILPNQMGDYVDDLYIHPSLQ